MDQQTVIRPNIILREDVNIKILRTRLERVKGQHRAEYLRNDREVKRFIKAENRKWIDNITSEA